MSPAAAKRGRLGHVLANDDAKEVKRRAREVNIDIEEVGAFPAPDRGVGGWEFEILDKLRKLPVDKVYKVARCEDAQHAITLASTARERAKKRGDKLKFKAFKGDVYVQRLP